MGFNLGAFTVGFAEGASKAIETRNTEIRKGAMAELDRLVGEAEKKEKGYRTERNELTQMADQLEKFAGAQGVGFTKTQLLGLIQQPQIGQEMISKLKSTENLEQVDFAKLFKPDENGTAMDPRDFILKKTSVAKDTAAPAPAAAPRTAFGLESPALRQAEASFEATTGRKVADVRGIAKGTIDLGAEFQPTKGVVDFSQFAKPETVATITGRLRDAKAKGEDLDSPKNKLLANQLAANAVIENQFKGDGEGGKPRTAAAINSIVDKSLRVGLGSYEMKGMIRFDPKTNEPVVIAGDAKAIEEYNNVKRSVVENQFKELDLIKGGKIVKDRNARDAILPYASIDKDDNVIWRKADTVIPETPPPAGPKVGAPSSVTAPAASQDISIPVDPIMAPDGSGVNRQAMQKAYKPGQLVKMPNGSTKIWNGINFQ